MRRKKLPDVYEPRLDGICGIAVDPIENIDILDPGQEARFLQRQGEPRAKAKAMRSILGRHVRVEDIT